MFNLGSLHLAFSRSNPLTSFNLLSGHWLDVTLLKVLNIQYKYYWTIQTFSPLNTHINYLNFVSVVDHDSRKHIDNVHKYFTMNSTIRVIENDPLSLRVLNCWILIQFYYFCVLFWLLYDMSIVNYLYVLFCILLRFPISLWIIVRVKLIWPTMLQLQSWVLTNEWQS